MTITVTYYTSADASAPTLSDAAGSLLGVLQAILVNGYGTKAAAGWSTAFTGAANQAVLRAGTGNKYYLNIDDSAATGTATYARVIGAVSASAFGLANLTTPFPSNAQLAGGLYWPRFPYSSATSPVRWACIATSQTFFFWNEGDGTNNGAQKYGQVFWFGDMDSYVSSDAYFTQIMGATSGAQRTVVYTAMGSNTVGLYMPGDYAQTVASDACGILTDYYKNGAQANMGGVTSLANSIAVPNPEDGAYYLSKIYAQESIAGGNSVRGSLPGIWNPAFFCLQGSAGAAFNAFDQFTGNSADGLHGKTFAFFPLSNAGTAEGGVVFEISNTWS